MPPLSDDRPLRPSSSLPLERPGARPAGLVAVSRSCRLSSARASVRLARLLTRFATPATNPSEAAQLIPLVARTTPGVGLRRPRDCADAALSISDGRGRVGQGPPTSSPSKMEQALDGPSGCIAAAPERPRRRRSRLAPCAPTSGSSRACVATTPNSALLRPASPTPLAVLADQVSPHWSPSAADLIMRRYDGRSPLDRRASSPGRRGGDADHVELDVAKCASISDATGGARARAPRAEDRCSGRGTPTRRASGTLPELVATPSAAPPSRDAFSAPRNRAAARDMIRSRRARARRLLSSPGRNRRRCSG